MNIILAIVIGYFLGSVNGAYVLGKLFKGIDIRKEGTSNAGAANAVVVMGWKFGALTFIIDALKAALSMWIVKYLTGSTDMAILAGVMAMIGHIYPVFMGFKGGKGIASILGIMLGLNGYITVVLYIVIVLGTLITNYIYWGELMMLILFPIAVYLFGYSNFAVVLIAAACILSAYKLRDNFSRVICGTEQKFSSVLLGKK